MLEKIRIRHDQICHVRKELEKRNNGHCEICHKQFTAYDAAVLDHDHDTGQIRGAIHRSCNAAEGKVRTKARWAHRYIGVTDFLIGLGKYLEKYRDSPRNYIHPAWKSDEEKRLIR